MSTWSAPATWTNGAVTAAQMNSETRDKSLWLKGFADLITNSTAADTGDSTYLFVRRSSTGGYGLNLGVTADAAPRFRIRSDGFIGWGDGTTADLLTVTPTVSGSIGFDFSGFLRVARATGLLVLSARLTGDDYDRLQVLTDGYLNWGNGVDPVDTTLRRSAAGIIELPASPETTLLKTGTATGNYGFRTAVTGDTNYRLSITAGGGLLWGTGSTTADAQLSRTGTSTMKWLDTRVDTTASATGTTPLSAWYVDSDSYPRLAITLDSTNNGVLNFGAGSGATDVTLYRAVTGALRTSGDFRSLGLLITRTAAGAISDSSFIGTATDGAIGVDTTNNRLYFRSGGTWYYINKDAP